MPSDIKIGISGAGVIHTDAENPDVDTRFRRARGAEAFDYLDRTPPVGETELYIKASQKYGLPMYSSGWYYIAGRDDAVLEQNLRVARECGAINHNVQVLDQNAAGQPVTNDEVLATLLCSAAELGERIGVTPCFEVHINMWSEHFGRVGEVARPPKRAA